MTFLRLFFLICTLFANSVFANNLAPKIVEPVYVGDSKVLVTNLSRGVQVVIMANGDLLSDPVISGGERKLVNLKKPLGKLEIQAVIAGKREVSSEPVQTSEFIGSHKPVIEPVHVGGKCISINNRLLQGTELKVFTSYSKSWIGSSEYHFPNHKIHFNDSLKVGTVWIEAKDQFGNKATSLPVTLRSPNDPPPKLAIKKRMVCDSRISISGVQSGATVRVTVNGKVVWNSCVAWPNFYFDLRTPLKLDDVIVASQEFLDGKPSDPATFTVTETRTLKSPRIASALSEGDRALTVLDLQPGADVSFEITSDGKTTTVGRKYSSDNRFVFENEFRKDDEIKVTQKFCNEETTTDITVQPNTGKAARAPLLPERLFQGAERIVVLRQTNEKNEKLGFIKDAEVKIFAFPANANVPTTLRKIEKKGSLIGTGFATEDFYNKSTFNGTTWEASRLITLTSVLKKGTQIIAIQKVGETWSVRSNIVSVDAEDIQAPSSISNLTTCSDRVDVTTKYFGMKTQVFFNNNLIGEAYSGYSLPGKPPLSSVTVDITAPDLTGGDIVSAKHIYLGNSTATVDAPVKGILARYSDAGTFRNYHSYKEGTLKIAGSFSVAFQNISGSNCPVKRDVTATVKSKNNNNVELPKKTINIKSGTNYFSVEFHVVDPSKESKVDVSVEGYGTLTVDVKQTSNIGESKPIVRIELTEMKGDHGSAIFFFSEDREDSSSTPQPLNNSVTIVGLRIVDKDAGFRSTDQLRGYHRTKTLETSVQHSFQIQNKGITLKKGNCNQCWRNDWKTKYPEGHWELQIPVPPPKKPLGRVIYLDLWYSSP